MHYIRIFISMISFMHSFIFQNYILIEDWRCVFATLYLLFKKIYWEYFCQQIY